MPVMSMMSPSRFVEITVIGLVVSDTLADFTEESGSSIGSNGVVPASSRSVGTNGIGISPDQSIDSPSTDVWTWP